ncbi:MAG: DUF721 domain-containing protein [Magnetovibrionaceae bacterium]
MAKHVAGAKGGNQSPEKGPKPTAAKPMAPKALARGRTRALSSLIEREVKPVFAKRGMADAQIAARWPEIVGPDLARQSAPEKVAYPGRERRGGTLHLAVRSGSLAIELQHLEPQLVERINRFFGYGAVARIKVRQTLSPAPIGRDQPKVVQPAPEVISAAKASVADIPDEDLRDALGRLGALVSARNPGTGRP